LVGDRVTARWKIAQMLATHFSQASQCPFALLVVLVVLVAVLVP
jgi:hypothetical protein